jgi:hypothetical protein
MTDTAADLRFAPNDLGFIADPYPVYAHLREHAPVLYDEATDHYLISRYEDVNALLRDRRFGRTYLHRATHAEMGHPDPPDWHDPFWNLINAGILDMEPPDHTRVRRLVSKAFTPRYVEGLRPRVQALMDGLVDRVMGMSSTIRTCFGGHIGRGGELEAVERTPVVSENLASVGHDVSGRVLEIEFRNGRIYQYFAVPRSVFAGLMGAGSKGEFFTSHIRGHYRYRRLR